MTYGRIEFYQAFHRLVHEAKKKRHETTISSNEQIPAFRFVSDSSLQTENRLRCTEFPKGACKQTSNSKSKMSSQV